MRSSFLYPLATKRNNTVSDYKMQAIVVGLIKPSTFMLCNYGDHTQHLSYSLRRKHVCTSDKVEVWLTNDSFLVQYGLRFLTFRLTDHDVAVIALSPIIKTLHLDIVRGLRLKMSNHVPVFNT